MATPRMEFSAQFKAKLKERALLKGYTEYAFDLAVTEWETDAEPSNAVTDRLFQYFWEAQLEIMRRRGEIE